MSAPLAWSVLCGTALGLGLWSLVSLMPRLSRPSLASRLAPYLLDVSVEAREFVSRTSVDPIPVLGTLFAPAFTALQRALSSVLGGSDTIERRLRQSGSSRSLDEFRSEQLVWALLSLAGGTVLVFAVPAIRTAPVIVPLVVPVFLGFGGALVRDWLLQRSANARLERMSSELPTILEFLTLSLSAGEGILDSLSRVARTSSGELSRELRGVVADVHTGVSLVTALQSMSRRVVLPAITRFVDQIAGALERGTPLAEVLRSQAQDGREIAKRDLLQSAGKKEVAMMVPLVFLILPLSIMFAIFPGLFVLQTGF